MKRCGRCKVEKELEAFGRHAGRSDGLQHDCKACRNAYVGARIKERAETDPAFRARRNETSRSATARYRATNSETINARRRGKPYSEAVRRWYAENVDRTRAHARRHTARRRATKKAATVVPFTLEQLEARLAFFGHRCWLCGVEAEAVDHVKPLSKGGAHCLANLRPICKSCNSRKGATWPLARVLERVA